MSYGSNIRTLFLMAWSCIEIFVIFYSRNSYYSPDIVKETLPRIDIKNYFL